MDQTIATAAVKVVNKNDPDQQTGRMFDGSGINNELMSAFFKVSPYELNNDQVKKMADIYDYARELTDDDSEMAILGVLKDIKYRLGSPRPGVTEIQHIHKYIKLRNSIKKMEITAKAMEQ